MIDKYLKILQHNNLTTTRKNKTRFPFSVLSMGEEDYEYYIFFFIREIGHMWSTDQSILDKLRISRGGKMDFIYPSGTSNGPKAPKPVNLFILPFEAQNALISIRMKPHFGGTAAIGGPTSAKIPIVFPARRA